jgi:hypothetical protein
MNETLSPIKLRKTFSHAKFSKMHSNALLAWLRLYDAKNGCYKPTPLEESRPQDSRNTHE